MVRVHGLNVSKRHNCKSGLATLLSGEGQKPTKDYMLSREEERSSYSRERVPLPCLSAAFLSKLLQSPQSPRHSFKNTNDAPRSRVTVEAGGPPVWHPNFLLGFDASVTPMWPPTPPGPVYKHV